MARYSFHEIDGWTYVYTDWIYGYFVPGHLVEVTNDPKVVARYKRSNKPRPQSDRD